MQGDRRAATRHAAESVARWRALGDWRERLWAQAWLVSSLTADRRAVDRRAYARAAALGEECVDSFRAAGDRWHQAASLQAAGIFHAGHDPARARALLEEAAALFRALGDAWWGNASLLVLNSVALRQGDHRAARATLEEALRAWRDRGDPYVLARIEQRLAYLLLRDGERRRATALLRASLARQRQLGSSSGIAAGLGGLAMVAHAEGRGRDAARLGGAAAALCEATGEEPDWALRPLADAFDVEMRSALGDTAFEAAHAEGRNLSLDAAVALALEQTDAV